MTFRRNKNEIHRYSKNQNEDNGRKIKYLKLEERRVLNATFAFDLAAAELTLSNFIDSGSGDNLVNVTQSGDDFVFDLEDGIWSVDGTAAGLDFNLQNGDSTLVVLDGASNLNEILFNDNTDDIFDVTFDQLQFENGVVSFVSPDFGFGSVSELSASSSISVSEFGFSAGSVDFQSGIHDFGSIDGVANNDILFSDTNDLNIQVLVSNFGEVNITAVGSIDIDDADSNLSTLAGDINIATTGKDSDIVIDNSIFSDGGSISISAADQLLLTPGSSIVSVGNGNIELFSNQVGGDDNGDLQMVQGSVVDADTGNIFLSNVGGTGTGDVSLTNVVTTSSSDEAVQVHSAGQILDASLNESSNINANFGGIQLSSFNDIGFSEFGDLNIDSDRLAFDAGGVIFVNDIGDGTTISALGTLAVSVTQGGGLIAADNLTISADVVASDSITFFSNRSSNVDNDIIVNNNAIVSLDSSTASTLVFNSADDLIFDSGSVTTSSSDSHHVILVADRESVVDGDVGSITNTGDGPANTISTNQLTLSSGDGIGASSGLDVTTGQPLRIAVDTIVAENSQANGIFLLENDDIAVIGITNTGREIVFTAESNITDGDTIPDDLDFDGGDVSITSNSGSIGSGSTNVFKTIADSIEVNATASLVATANNGLIAINQTIQTIPTTFNAESLIFYSDGDLNVSTITAFGTFNVTNLGLVADGDNDGVGTLTIGENIVVAGDLRVEGHEIIALDAADQPVTPTLQSDRLLISTDTSGQFNTTTNMLDIEFDSAVDDPTQIDNQSVFVNNSTAVELVDLNCDSHSVLSTNDDVKIQANGDINIEEQVAVGDATFFISTDGNLHQSVSAEISATSLGLMIEGQTLLNEDNDIAVLAANNGGFTSITATGNLEIGNVVFASTSPSEMAISGLSTSDNDAKIAVLDNLLLSESANMGTGSMILSVGGNVEQSNDGAILAHGLGLMVGGSASFNSENDVAILATQTDDILVFNDINDLEIGTVEVAVGSASAMSIQGIFTNDNDAKISSRNLEIAEQIDVGSATFFLNASGDVTQSANGIIVADNLGVMATGQVTLDAQNSVNTAASSSSGHFIFSNTQDLEIGSVTVAVGTDFEMTISGVTTVDSDAKISSQNLLISQAIATELGNTFLATDGNISQSSIGTISSNGLGIMSSGSAILDAFNDVGDFAAETNGLTVFNDINSLNIRSVSAAAGSPYEMMVDGITTNDNDAKIVSVENINIESAIETGAASLFINASGNVSQSVAGTISADGLGLMVDGQTTLNSDNQVNVLAADNGSFLVFKNFQDLVTGDVQVANGMAFEMTVDGVTVSNGELKITAEDLSVQNLIEIENGSAFFNVSANVTQTESGIILAEALGIMSAGEVKLDAENDINVLASQSNGTFLFNDIDDLEVGIVTVIAGTSFEMSVSGITTVDSDTKIASQNLLINQSISTGLGNTFLATDGNISQSSIGTISSNGLGIMGSGSAILEADNDINVFAAQTNGLIVFNDVDDLEIGLVNAAVGSQFEMMVQGLTTSNNDAKLASAGSLSLNAQVYTGTGITFIESSGGLSQSDTGTISAAGLGLMVGGQTILDGNNQVEVLALENNSSLIFNNSQDLTIGTVQVATGTTFEMAVSGISTNGNDAKVSVDGSLQINNSIFTGTGSAFLAISGNIAQSDTGTIIANQLGLMVGGMTVLDSDNDVDMVAANNVGQTIIFDIDDLVVSSVSVLAGTDSEMVATGITTVSQDAKISSGDLTVENSINTGMANLFLKVDGSLTQAINGQVFADGLGLMVAGSITLDAENDVNVLASYSFEQTIFIDVDNLEVGSVSVATGSAFEMNLDDATVFDGDLKITSGDMLIASSIEILNGNGFFDVLGGIAQTESGTIFASHLGVMSTGNVILDAENDVDVLAAQSNERFLFNDVDDLEIGQVNVALGTGFAMSLDGINSNNSDSKLAATDNIYVNSAISTGTGNLFLVANGNVAQSSTGTISAESLGLMVGGSTQLDANNVVTTFAANNFGSVVFANINEFNVGSVIAFAGSEFEMTATGITTWDSDVKLIASQDLNLSEMVNSGIGTTFLSAAGDLEQLDSGSIVAGKLGLMVGGDALLKLDNDVDILAAQNTGKLIFNDIDDLEIGSVLAFQNSIFEMSIDGIESQSDIKISTSGNILIAENIAAPTSTLFIATGGNLEQTQDAKIEAQEFGLMVDGSVELAAQNDVDVFAGSSSNSFLFNDIDDLSISIVSVFAGTDHEMMVDGLVTEDSQAKVTTGGDLQIDSIISTVNSDLFLMIDGNIGQSGTGSIIATGLGIVASGQTILDLDNQVNEIAAANDGLIVFNNRGDLEIGEVTVFASSSFEMSVVGITTPGDVKLSVDGSVQQNSTVDVANSTFFVSATGSYLQIDDVSIFGNALGLMIDGEARLESGNDVDEFAASNEALLIFNDIDDLAVSTVTVANGTIYEMLVQGITTNNDDIKLTTSGNLLIDDSINVGSGQVVLMTDGNLAQSIGDSDGVDGVIVADSLGIVVAGTSDLSNPVNSFNEFAAETIGNIQLSNSNDLTIGSVSVAGMTVEGMKTEGSVVAFVAGSLDQIAAVQVSGTTFLSAQDSVCLVGADCTGDGQNDNDFVGRVDVIAGTFIEIIDANDLVAGNISAANHIYLESGQDESGQLTLEGDITTTDQNGQVFLRANNRVIQNAATSVVSTTDLLLGSTSDNNQVDFMLNGNNMVSNLAADISGRLELVNQRDLQIAPLSFNSRCNDFAISFEGLDVMAIRLDVAPGQMTQGNLTDSDGAKTFIQTSAEFNVANDIVLGDGSTMLEFTNHSINQLTSSNFTGNNATIDAGGDVSLFVNSTIILSDVNVDGTLHIDTLEPLTNGSAGDILQSFNEDGPSKISATDAAFVSNASLQLINTSFERLAIDANQNSSQAISAFSKNTSIGQTFTGSIDADFFDVQTAEKFNLNGETPINGVFDIDPANMPDGFSFESGNNSFLNTSNVGAIIVNCSNLELVSFDMLDLEFFDSNDVTNSTAASVTLGDTYIETANAPNSNQNLDLDISANVVVTQLSSNTTIVAGGELSLNNGAEFIRLDQTEIIGLVNTLQREFLNDHFEFIDPRSVIAVPGDAAFSDLNAQLDSAVGFQQFDFVFGNPGEQSFNLIVGWFVDGISPSQAINPADQQDLLQLMTDTTNEFLLSNFQTNFGQQVSTFSIRADATSPLTLSNITPFDSSFFADQSFLLSQVFITNDSRINLFEDGGATDLNFSQEVIPTRTVVQNPEVIVVARPTFAIPESPGSAPVQESFFVSLIQEPESAPLVIGPAPKTFFEVRYTADDDGIFEQSFEWKAENDDPDAIRAAIERAKLSDAEWPDTTEDPENNWTDRIRKDGEVKPGLYYIFEVQEGTPIPEPVDAPVDRTDIENMIESESESSKVSDEPSSDDAAIKLDQDLLESTRIQETRLAVDENAHIDESRLSRATTSALLSSSLMLGQLISNEKSDSVSIANLDTSNKKNMFSRAARFRRKNLPK